MIYFYDYNYSHLTKIVVGLTDSCMKFNNILEYIFSAPSNISVLRVLNERNFGISGREVARLTDLSLRTVQVSLLNLEKTGIVKRYTGKREHQFVLERKKFLTRNLIRHLFNVESEFNQNILSLIKKSLHKDVDSIILFGSVVNKNDTIDSDLDVCFVYSGSLKKIQDKISVLRTDLADEYQITLAPFFITSSKFRSLGLKGSPPVKDILKYGKVISGKSIKILLNGKKRTG